MAVQKGDRSPGSVAKLVIGAALVLLGVLLWIVRDNPAFGLVSGLGVVLAYSAAQPWLERWRNG